VRVWDLPAGYLSRQSLLGEHRELHGLYNIVVYGKAGYARHPETRRWVDALGGLVWRHRQLRAEMRLRGYVDRTPLRSRTRVDWPTVFVTPPCAQFALLSVKYANAASGRIPLPRTAHDLWAQHKYSVMARDPRAYRAIGRAVSRMRRGASVDSLAVELVMLLRLAPSAGPLLNAIEHMWGHVRPHASENDLRAARDGTAALLAVTQTLAVRCQEPYLMRSTALSELETHLDSLPTASRAAGCAAGQGSTSLRQQRSGDWSASPGQQRGVSSSRATAVARRRRACGRPRR